MYAVLIVDDDPHLRTLCRIALEEAGYSVGEASNGKEALAETDTTSFDLIVLDLCMPDMDGFEFLKTVRVNSPKLKIVVISGYLAGKLLRAATLFGAFATLAKPFSPDSLCSVVREVLTVNGPVGAPD